MARIKFSLLAGASASQRRVCLAVGRGATEAVVHGKGISDGGLLGARQGALQLARSLALVPPARRLPCGARRRTTQLCAGSAGGRLGLRLPAVWATWCSMLSCCSSRAFFVPAVGVGRGMFSYVKVHYMNCFKPTPYSDVESQGISL